MTLYLSLLTAHLLMPADHGLNERNCLLAAEHKGYTVGTMVNSYHERSYLLGYTHRMGNWQVGLYAATGYQDTPMVESTYAGLLFYPSVGYNMPINNSVAVTATLSGVVANAGLTLRF